MSTNVELIGGDHDLLLCGYHAGRSRGTSGTCSGLGLCILHAVGDVTALDGKKD